MKAKISRSPEWAEDVLSTFHNIAQDSVDAADQYLDAIEDLFSNLMEHPELGEAADRADQSFDEWMRERNVRHCLDLHYIDNPEIGVPLVESEQRVVVPRGQAARSELKYRGPLDLEYLQTVYLNSILVVLAKI